jgi:hypothetical protein
MNLNKWKAWPVKNSEVVLKIDKKIVTTKRRSYDQFLAKIKFSDPDKSGTNGSKKNSNQFWYSEHQNPSSYAKIMTSLKTDPELEGRTGIIHAKVGHRIKDLMETMRKTHELDSNTT